jgi:hypothetical protein
MPTLRERAIEAFNLGLSEKDKEILAKRFGPRGSSLNMRYHLTPRKWSLTDRLIKFIWWNNSPFYVRRYHPIGAVLWRCYWVAFKLVIKPVKSFTKDLGHRIKIYKTRKKAINMFLKKDIKQLPSHGCWWQINQGDD